MAQAPHTETESIDGSVMQLIASINRCGGTELTLVRVGVAYSFRVHQSFQIHFHKGSDNRRPKS